MASTISATRISDRIAGQAAPAARAPEALHQPGLVERAQLLLEEAKGDLLRLGDRPSRDQPVALLARRMASSTIARIAYSVF